MTESLTINTAQLITIIDQGQPTPKPLRQIVNRVLQDNPALESALTAQRYIDLGKGKHLEPGSAYTLAGEDLYRSPSTIRDHYAKYRKYIDPDHPEYSE